MIIVPNEECPPLFDEIVAFWFFGDFFCSRYGKDKMKIGMNQFLVLDTGWAGTTGIGMIAGTAVPAINELCIGDGQRQLFIAFGPKEHLGMAHTVIPDGLNQFLLDRFLPDDFFKQHALHPKSGSKFMGFPDGKDFLPNKNHPGIIA